jgi:uncharacterized phage protein (TIGR01671 family)
MNRELKFRVWDLQRKYFSSEYDIYCSNGSVSSNGSGIVDPNGHHFIPQQYTGLKDRHEKEIYEGDIVKIIYDEAVAEVYFDFNLGAFRLKDNSGKSYPITTYRFDESNKPIGLISVVDEVIGNIMENPELLKA